MLNSSLTTTDLFHNNLLLPGNFTFTAFQNMHNSWECPNVQRRNYFKSSQSKFSVNCLLCNCSVSKSWSVVLLYHQLRKVPLKSIEDDILVQCVMHSVTQPKTTNSAHQKINEPVKSDNYSYRLRKISDTDVII